MEPLDRFVGLPEPPSYSQEEFDRYKKQRNPMPMMFEWFKYVGILAESVASIHPASSDYVNHPPVHQAVVRGLLHRCARLIISIMKLTHDHKCAESAGIIGRAILESAVKVHWLCTRDDRDDAFSRYLADGLKTDTVFEDLVGEAIASRGGGATKIEQRILRSIENCRRTAGMDRKQVEAAKRLPDYKTILTDPALEYGEIDYIVVQRLPSHGVHGTWPDLVFHYIEERGDGGFGLVDTDCAVPHASQFATPALYLANAVRSCVWFLIENETLRADFDSHINGVIANLTKTCRLAWDELTDELCD